MKLAEAIEIKQRTGDDFLSTDPDDLDEADRLSIEALKRIKEDRHFSGIRSTKLLPGETEE